MQFLSTALGRGIHRARRQLHQCPAMDAPARKQGELQVMEQRCRPGMCSQQWISCMLQNTAIEICTSVRVTSAEFQWMVTTYSGIRFSQNVLKGGGVRGMDTSPPSFSGMRCLWCFHAGQPGCSLFWEHACTRVGLAPLRVGADPLQEDTPRTLKSKSAGKRNHVPPKPGCLTWTSRHLSKLFPVEDLKASLSINTLAR